MTPSDELKAFTKHSEGCRLTAYPDNGACSIGYGHRGVPEGTVWTQEQCDTAFEQDIAEKAALVGRYVAVQLTQGQFDALCDLFYNEKLTELIGSRLLATINAGRYNAVPEQLYRVDPETGEAHGWILSEGKPNKGLIARRQGEIAFWNGSSNPPSATE